MRSSHKQTRIRVIVVDDDPGILRAVQRVLQVHGYDAEVFNSVEDFLERAHLEEATCLVLDVHLQHESGIELRHQLTRSGHSLPVIFITAAENEVTRKAALEAGCVAYLQKPFPSRLLIEAVETVIRNDSTDEAAIGITYYSHLEPSADVGGEANCAKGLDASPP